MTSHADTALTIEETRGIDQPLPPTHRRWVGVFREEAVLFYHAGKLWIREVVAGDSQHARLARVRGRMVQTESELPVPCAAQVPAVFVRDLQPELRGLRLRERHRLVPEDECLPDVRPGRRGYLQHGVMVRLDDPDVLHHPDLAALELLRIAQDVPFFEERIVPD